jgi:hypothetical protein
MDQVEIGKKGFLKPFKFCKITVRRLWRLWKILVMLIK